MLDLNRKILVVDDEELHLTMMTYFCKKIGLTPTLASNAQDALDVISRESFDIVISDINMPIMKGTNLMQKICELHKEKATFRFFMTGDINRSEIENQYKEYVHDILTKPFTMNDLKEFLLKNGYEL